MKIDNASVVYLLYGAMFTALMQHWCSLHVAQTNSYVPGSTIGCGIPWDFVMCAFEIKEVCAITGKQDRRQAAAMLSA